MNPAVRYILDSKLQRNSSAIKTPNAFLATIELDSWHKQ